MPRSIEEGFEGYLAKLKATAPESDAAKRHRASIEACLKSNFGLKRFVRIGSFGNGTSISGYSDVDYLASIPTSQLTESSTPGELRTLSIMFQRRHLLAHAEGIVDAKYLANTGDPEYAAGQRIVVRPQDVRQMIDILSKLAQEIRTAVAPAATAP